MLNIDKEVVPQIDEPAGKYSGEHLIEYNMGTTTQVYLFHEPETIYREEGDQIIEVHQERAFFVVVNNPVTRGKIIDAAEKKAYGLETVEDWNSFTASLARKARIGEDLEEVVEHDNFIADVKADLTAKGIIH